MLIHRISWKVLKFWPKNGNKSGLNEYMKTYGEKRSRSLFDLCPRTCHNLTISNISLKTVKPVVSIFHM